MTGSGRLGGRRCPAWRWRGPWPTAARRRGGRRFEAAIEAEKLNRVVVAGCSQRLYAAEFEGLMRGAGLDPRLLARVNLREQVVYPHRPDRLADGQPVRSEAASQRARWWAWPWPG